MKFAHIERTSLSDYPGRVCSLLYTVGCNFRCPFCYNAVAPRKIFIVHGDYTQEFTGELINMGFDAVAPKLGDEF